MLTWVLNTPLLFEDSSNALFFQRIFYYPVSNYMFKVSNRNTKTRYEICSRLTIKTPERCHCHRSGVFIVNLEHISHLFSVSIVNFEQIHAAWVWSSWNLFNLNDTHRERLVFHSIQYMNGWLAASNLFDMFTQSIKFHTFHYQYRCLKNVIHQIKDVKELSSLIFLIK